MEEGGKVARRLVPPTLIEHSDSIQPTENGEPSSPELESQTKFYREALLAQWKHPDWPEFIKMQAEGSVRLDAYTRISDEELNTIIAKFPKGCLLTMSLDCFHGGQMYGMYNLALRWGEDARHFSRYKLEI